MSGQIIDGEAEESSDDDIDSDEVIDMDTPGNVVTSSDVNDINRNDGNIGINNDAGNDGNEINNNNDNNINNYSDNSRKNSGSNFVTKTVTLSQEIEIIESKPVMLNEIKHEPSTFGRFRLSFNKFINSSKKMVKQKIQESKRQRWENSLINRTNTFHENILSTTKKHFDKMDRQCNVVNNSCKQCVTHLHKSTAMMSKAHDKLKKLSDQTVTCVKLF